MTDKSASIVKKVSVRTIVGDIQVLIRNGELSKALGVDLTVDGAKAAICQIFAHAGAVANKDTDFGQSWKLTGMFEGISLVSGETVKGAVCYLPSVISDLVAGQLMNNADAQAVRFAGEIGIQIDHKAATGYVYTFRPLVMEAADLLSDLKAKVAALPAPEAPKADTLSDAPAGKGKGAK